MQSFEPVRFGLIGSGWVTRQHARALRAIPEAEVVACADVPRERGDRPGNGYALAVDFGIERYHADFREMLARPDIEAVTVALPNNLHAEVALAALEAGKHVVLEKPMCLTLDEADRIAEAAVRNIRVVAYAEQLVFCPKNARAKELVDAGALGDVFHVRHMEAHEGPYSTWFFDPALAGGGALMDLGCHSIEFARWIFDKRRALRVTAKMATHVHRGDRSPREMLEDHAVLHLEFEGGKSALVEAGWTRKGGMVSRAEIEGTEGLLTVDLLRDDGMELYSTAALSNAEVPSGWSRPDWEWLWQNGFPQEMAEFSRAIRDGRAPLESIDDGRAVLEILWAAYASAADGRTIDLAYRPDRDERFPVRRWLERRMS